MNEASKASFRYFTGTGNSKRVAQACAEEFSGRGWDCDIACLPEGGPPAEGSVACLVFPVYSLDMPRIVRRYLEALPRRGEGSPRPRALVLATGGNADDCGWSLIEAVRLLSARGYDPAYADLVHMPNNWGTFMKVPAKEEAAAILAAGEAKARASARAFLAGERYAKPLSTPVFGPLGSRLMRAGFKLGVRRLWTKFGTTEACSSCGLCARSCPVGSIKMEPNGPGRELRPRWSGSCEQCMRCFNLCPSRAIVQFEAIGHGSRRERWMAPGFKPIARD